MSIALLIIDMQVGCREFTKDQGAFDSAVEYINAASELFRAKGLPVVVVQDVELDGGPGHAGFEVVPGITRDAKDIVVHKEYNNSFCKTKLSDILKEKGVRFVVVSGFAAEYCVLFTYNGAKENGFQVSLLQNGVAGIESEEARRMQLLRPVVSLPVLEHFLSL